MNGSLSTPGMECVPHPNSRESSNYDYSMGVMSEGLPSELKIVANPARAYSRNVVVSLTRIAVFAACGVLMPAYLTRHLSSAVYGAWILIVQMANYISYLDLGIQTAIAKYIAQYAARSEVQLRNQYASAGTAIMTVSSLFGVLLSIGLAMLVPYLFPDMPPSVAADVARGVLLVGISTAVLLAASPFAAFFLGLQRYAVPTFLSISNKLLYVAAIVVMVEQHRSLTEMGAAVAVINVVTALLQILVSRALLPQIRVHISLVVWPVAKQIVGYCAILGIWTAGVLIISGLDTTIVGHFELNATAYYAVAATPVNFLAMILQAALNPLMPAVSALSVSRTSEHLGVLLGRSTRYVTLVLQAVGLPLILFGFIVLSAWVGPAYAQHGLTIMRLLVLAYIVRNLCGPYATMVMATGRQKAATLSGVCEAVVNLVSSIVLGRYYGATGVAVGTLIGAVVGVLVHFFVSMPQTQKTFLISPGKLFRTSVMRPGVAALPTLLILPLLWRPTPMLYTLPIVTAWVTASALLVWYAGLTNPERNSIAKRLCRVTFREE